MFIKMKIFIYLIIIFLVSSLLFMVLLLNAQKAKLEKKIIEKDIELNQSKNNNFLLKNEILNQNKIIEKNKFAYEKKLKNFQEYNAKQEFKKYESYTLLGLKSNDCTDIKNTINVIRAISF